MFSHVPTGLSGSLPAVIPVVSSMHQVNMTITAGVKLDKVFNGWISSGAMNV